MSRTKSVYRCNECGAEAPKWQGWCDGCGASGTLAEAAALPPTAIAPLPERRGLDVAVGAVGSFALDNLADSVILVRAAIELCAHARGLQIVDARVRYGTAHAPIDGRTRQFLSDTVRAEHR